MSQPEKIGDILPRVLDHIWGVPRFEYGSQVYRCPCGIIRENNGEHTRYWRWQNGTLKQLHIPPEHQEKQIA